MTDANNPDNTTPELNLDDVVNTNPEELSDEQKTFLDENKENLTPEQKEKFGIKEEAVVPNLDDIEPETRGGKKEVKKDDEPPADDDTEIDPEDKKNIGKVVKEHLAPVTESLKQVQELRDRAEVDGLITDKPEYKPYRAVILKYMAHSAYKDIPAHNIAAIVAARDLEKIGAKKERDAKKKADDTKNPGNQVRKTGGKMDWGKASKADFEAQRAKVLNQQG